MENTTANPLSDIKNISSKVIEEKLVCETLENIWKVVADMVIDFKDKGVPVTTIVSTSLQGSRALINLCKSHPKLAHDKWSSEINAVQGMCVDCCGADIVARIECELNGIEDRMISEAVNAGLSDEYIMQWQNKIKERWIERGKIKQTSR